VTPEELEAEAAKARKHVAEREVQFRALEAEVSRLASTQPTPVLLAILQALVETVCAAQGPYFTIHNKTKFYKSVILMLREKGIS